MAGEVLTHALRPLNTMMATTRRATVSNTASKYRFLEASRRSANPSVAQLTITGTRVRDASTLEKSRLCHNSQKELGEA